MIDTRELRIGSHVLHNGKLFKVKEIAGDLVAFKIKKNQKSTGLWDAATFGRCLDPTPITCDLLRDLGFKPNESLYNHESEWTIDLDGYTVTMMKGEANHISRDWSVHIDNWDYDTVGSADVASLHQLEGIIYLCTGEELIKD